MSAQRLDPVGADGGIGTDVAPISACSSGPPGSMSARLAGMPRATRAAHNCLLGLPPGRTVDAEGREAEPGEQGVELLLLGGDAACR